MSEPFEFFIKKGDLEPPLQATVTGSNLTAATAKLFMRRKADGAIVVNGQPVTISNISVPNLTADLSYAWQSGDTGESGDFEAEFEVTFASLKKRTFPTDSYIRVKVVDDIG